MFRTAVQPQTGKAAAAGRPARSGRRRATDLSVSGLTYGALIVFMGVAAVNTQANLLFAVLGVMVGVLLVALVLSWVVLRRLEVRRMLPAHAVVGRPVTISYAVKNNKRFWPALSINVTELDADRVFTRRPQVYALHAAPGMSAVVPVTLTPRRRGLHTLDRHQVSTSFPFGFVRRAAMLHAPATLLVFPAIGEVAPRVLAALASAESTGRNVRPRRGGQDEFFGTREYRPGDPPRMIHWRRSATSMVARLPLVTKEMTHVSPPRLLIVVDNHAPADTDLPAAERTVAVAASLADAALARQLQAGVVAFAGDEAEDGIEVLPPNAGKRHRRDALSVLARLPRNRTHGRTALVEAARRHAGRDVSVVLVTPHAEQPLHVPRDSQHGGPVVLSSGDDELVGFAPGIRFDRARRKPEPRHV